MQKLGIQLTGDGPDENDRTVELAGLAGLRSAVAQVFSRLSDEQMEPCSCAWSTTFPQGAAPARCAAAYILNVPPAIAPRRPSVSRAMYARLCSVSSRAPVSSLFFSR